MNIKLAVVATVVGVMTLCLGATKPLANQAFAATPCSLTASAVPGSGSIASGESMGQTISGKLSCGGTGLGGATIVITSARGVIPHIPQGPSWKQTYMMVQDKATGEFVEQSTTTDSSGNYNQGIVASAGVAYHYYAHFPGDSQHQPASAETYFDLKVGGAHRFKPG